MYTWGYIKEAALAKLDVDESEGTADWTQQLLNRFHIYANEAMTQICSSIKPNRTFAMFIIAETEQERDAYLQMYGDAVVHLVNEEIKMPEDFVGFGDDVCTIDYMDKYGKPHFREECHGEFEYVGHNKLYFTKAGTYRISYNARWYKFTEDIPDGEELDIPADILDCIPSYIAHQCYKVDDETKSAIYRNEYEMFLARIDDTDYKKPKTIVIDGGW